MTPATTTPDGPTVHVQPGAAPELHAAVAQAGVRSVADPAEASGLVWSDKDVDALQAALHPGVRWVQLPDAGVERWLAAGVLGSGPAFTSARGCYDAQVAEHALALLLAAARRLPECASLTSWPAREHRPTGRSLRDAAVAVVGAGGIGSALIELLAPLGARVHAVTRSGRDVTGADASWSTDGLADLLPEVDFVVLATPSTPQTRHMVDAPQLAAMRSDAWLVNVGRGDLVDTDALVDALRGGEIAGAALDVTDPEPLPDDHPLWSLPNALVTPHVANPPQLKTRSLAARVRENARRFAAGEPLLGLVDEEAGY